MIYIRATFLCEKVNDEIEHAVQHVLICWRNNGQIDGDWVMAKRPGAIDAYLITPKRGALSAKNTSEYARESLNALKALGVRRPLVTTLGDGVFSFRGCNCRARPFFVMFTKQFDQCSAMQCGNCFSPVALYEIPAPDRFGHGSILEWQARYKECDEMYMGSNVGEAFGARQISNVTSALAKSGREIARVYEALTETPVYYYLIRLNGQSLAKEQARRCPSCDRPWHLSKPLSRLYDFQCKPCRLVSNIGFNVAPYMP